MTKANNNRPDRGRNKKNGNVTPVIDKSAQIAKELRLRPKTKALFDEVLNNPKITQREAYIRTHQTTNNRTADVQASRLLNSSKYAIYKSSVVGKAKKRVATLIDSTNESIALKASQDVLDRTEGKAVQRNENFSRSVEVKLDLSGMRIGTHYLTGATTIPLPE